MKTTHPAPTVTQAELTDNLLTARRDYQAMRYDLVRACVAAFSLPESSGLEIPEEDHEVARYVMDFRPAEAVCDFGDDDDLLLSDLF